MVVRSLRTRLMLSYFATIFVASWITGSLVLGQMRQTLLEEKGRSVLLSGNMVAHAGEEILYGPGQKQALRALAREMSSQVGARVLFLTANGTVFADAFSEMEGTRLVHPVVKSAGSGDSATSVQTLRRGHTLYAAVPMFKDQRVSGITFLSADLEPVLQGLDQTRRLILVGSIAGGLVAAALGYLFASGLTKPLRQLARIAHLLSLGRLEHGMKVPQASDEVGELSKAFQKMLEHLETEDRMRTMFVENASHELRSPLASLRALAQGLLEDPKADLALCKEFLYDVDREIDRLDGLAKGLLDLTRSQALSQGFIRESTSVRELAERVRARLQAMADAKGAAIKIQGDEVWPLEAQWFETAVYNLVDNALKYVPERGGTVTVCMRRDGTNLIVSVEDNGEGIPPGDLPHVFERFYRVDKARTRSTGGTGLGLSIVRYVVEAHRGTIEVTSEMGLGSLFTIVVPGETSPGQVSRNF